MSAPPHQADPVAVSNGADAPPPEAERTLVAVDLGSNSFHMIVAKQVGGRLQVIDRIKDMVRLAEGLDADNRLGLEAMDRGIECLRRFGQRLRDVPASNVRVVGTNTLRKARNSAEFVLRAEQALGHEIDIIAGHEEARLIFLGVSHALEDDNEWRLVMDIGGGSTEVILGRHFEAAVVDSLHIGCVSLSQRFFPGGVIDPARLRAAELAALQEFEPIALGYRRHGWDTAIGASGTILAARDILHAQGWASEGIPRDSLVALRDALQAAGQVEKLDLQGLTKQRAPVFPGGFAVLSAAFQALDIDHMRVADGALREGCLYDLLGRFQHQDIRERTVTELGQRYNIDADQAQRVERTALTLLSDVAAPWELNYDRERAMLRWAARLHEIGLAISHSQYHKHGAYLVSNLDMPGFSRGEQRVLSVLIRGQRRKFPAAELETLHPHMRQRVVYLCALFRLSVLLHRARSNGALPALTVQAKPKRLRVDFSEGWLAEHHLTRADLEQEAAYLKAAEVKLKFR